MDIPVEKSKPFQRCMNNILAKVLRKYILVYLDDIIIYSQTGGDHIKQIENALQIFTNNGLNRLNRHIISPKGLSPGPQNFKTANVVNK